jgi:hypothetical protein
MRCWKGSCRHDIIGEIHAQWTWVDFIAYYTCEAHCSDGMDLLEVRTVDGQVPVDVWLARWQTPMPWHLAKLYEEWQP